MLPETVYTVRTIRNTGKIKTLQDSFPDIMKGHLQIVKQRRTREAAQFKTVIECSLREMELLKVARNEKVGDF